MGYAIARPHEHQNGAEGHKWMIANQEDDENGEEAERPESTQARGDGVVWRSADLCFGGTCGHSTHSSLTSPFFHRSSSCM